ncbi:DUF4352 domain-containing protein [Halosimplex pelagicum]|uniref:DUF4352 domain-containing protein n=1 Tax=Halosimplex pelagicum TaxID=869886 RepID=A0A7D5P5D6_9EURY|nr:DUF4352 domain-containing protein [Halosimplex pelagicum]QLH81317.1 DUF4352 domain-containing protein [Halosimplex pelagicum]
MNGRAIVAWVLGVLLTFLGLLLLIGAPPIGIITVLVGLYILPPVNRRISIDIPPGWAAAWTGGVLLLLFGLVLLERIPLAGGIAVFGGLFALPPLRRQITSRSGLELRRGVVVAIVLLAAVGAVSSAAVAVATDETLGSETKIHDVGDQFVVDEDETDLALTVQAVNQTYSLDRPTREWAKPPEEAYLVVTLRIENTGDHHVTFQDGVFAAVSEDGERSYEMHEDTNAIPERGPYRAPGLELSPTTSGPRLEGGETITRTVAFRVERGRMYLFTVPATGSFSGADRHYVPLGNV